MVTITRDNEETLLWVDGREPTALTLSDLEHVQERAEAILEQMEGERCRGEF